jgi:hypothetical protein
MKSIKHYCLDIVDPVKYSKNYKKNHQTFSTHEYLKYANKAIKEILKKKKTPIICGGTGLYIDSILYGLPKNAKPNPLLRKELEKEDLKSLLNRIKELNKDKWSELIKNDNPSERNNKRRLIRIIEILNSKKVICPVNTGLILWKPIKSHLQNIFNPYKLNIKFYFNLIDKQIQMEYYYSNKLILINCPIFNRKLEDGRMVAKVRTYFYFYNFESLNFFSFSVF